MLCKVVHSGLRQVYCAVYSCTQWVKTVGILCCVKLYTVCKDSRYIVLCKAVHSV